MLREDVEGNKKMVYKMVKNKKRLRKSARSRDGKMVERGYYRIIDEIF